MPDFTGWTALRRCRMCDEQRLLTKLATTTGAERWRQRPVSASSDLPVYFSRGSESRNRGMEGEPHQECKLKNQQAAGYLLMNMKMPW